MGHLEAFEANLLAPQPNSDLDRLFAFGIDPVDGSLPVDQPSDWPTCEAVTKYVAETRQRVNEALSWSQIENEDLLLNVAIEHRLMHAETLTYLLHQLPLEKKVSVSLPANRQAEALWIPQVVAIPEGIATLGLCTSSGQFGWDNEFQQHRVDVPAFRIDRYKVSNGQYLAFI